MLISFKKSQVNEGRDGFALVATLSVMVLLMVLLLGMLSLSVVEVRGGQRDSYQQIARSNARLALMMALGALQRTAGPDQRVTARANILGDDAMIHPNWLGVWRTTYDKNGQGWPLIGKHIPHETSPYASTGMYSDLRTSHQELKEGQWRDRLFVDWLVSRSSQNVDPRSSFGTDSKRMVELVGRGTLGKMMSNPTYQRNHVAVEKVDIATPTGMGAYAWYVSDNNQKASVAYNPHAGVSRQKAFLATVAENPSALESSGVDRPFARFVDVIKSNEQKIISDQSVALLGRTDTERKLLRVAMGSYFHDLTTHASGLFVDVTLGGLKNDLTPVLFAQPEREVIQWTEGVGTSAMKSFSTDDPIIPGATHAVLGPSFGALRSWGRLKSHLHEQTGVVDAQVRHHSIDSMRARPSSHWPYHLSDGVTFDGGRWASQAPKLHPIMTDVRWHYYFSHTDDTPMQSLRTHLIPRVCMWNPYNITMKSPALIVLMPNPYWKETNAFHFYVKPREAQRLKSIFKDPKARKSVEGVQVTKGAVAAWGYRGDFKVRVRGSKDDEGEDGLFPDSRYLGFVLEPTDFAPGACLVFSPRVDRVNESADGVDIQKYDTTRLSANVLSAQVLQGENHFFHEYKSKWLELQCVTPSGKPSWRRAPAGMGDQPGMLEALQLSEIERYTPAWRFKDTLPFILKSSMGTLAVRAEAVSSQQSYLYPTLQLINHGNGGEKTFQFSSAGSWGSNDADPSSGFRGLATFREEPRRDAPALHQVGTKLLWLDESLTEANQPPLRQGGNGTRWNPDHLAYHPATIAQWNVRPGLVTRSPSSPCASMWYTMSSGAWMLQFSPRSPRSFEDLPSLDAEGRYFSKSPFASASAFPDAARNAVLFDLPNPTVGALSLGMLRHAQLSPYSWHPTYLVAHSLVDLHAPYASTAHTSQALPYRGDKPSGWDAITGGEKESNPRYGPKSEAAISTGLLQIGNHPAVKTVNGQVMTSRDEVLAYDIAFEVNQNLWDHYFFSGIPMKNGFFDWNPSQNDRLENQRYRSNRFARQHAREITQRFRSGADGVGYGFWNNASFLTSRAAFNVNSTSVPAWTALLSGLRGLKRETRHDERSVDDGGRESGGDLSMYSRVQVPFGSVTSDDTGVAHHGGWEGGRCLTDTEVATLAREIVKQVKLRGPFVSLADFVNRRLAPKSDISSHRGAIDQAIKDAGLNQRFLSPRFRTSKNNSIDNNHKQWRVDVDKMPESKAWGIPGFLTQGDILEPLAPAMTVRGDSFLIRAYGEARDAQQNIKAKAYLEAVVVRSVEYINPGHAGKDGNQPSDAELTIDRCSGALVSGRITPVNKKFGRRFRIKQSRWLSAREV